MQLALWTRPRLTGRQRASATSDEAGRNAVRATRADGIALDELAAHLTPLAELGRRPSPIRRARVAIGLAHPHAGVPRPDQNAGIRALERGIGRVHGSREEGAPPLLEHELARVVRVLGDSPREDRDRAMLLVGFQARRASD